jgi:hypothetical protein
MARERETTRNADTEETVILTAVLPFGQLS